MKFGKEVRIYDMIPNTDRFLQHIFLAFSYLKVSFICCRVHQVEVEAFPAKAFLRRNQHQVQKRDLTMTPLKTMYLPKEVCLPSFLSVMSVMKFRTINFVAMDQFERLGSLGKLSVANSAASEPLECILE